MKKNIKILFFAVLCSVVLFSTVAYAAEGSKSKMNVGVGVGAVISTSEYKQTDAYVLPYPILSYEGERFYVRGLSAGMHLYKSDMHEFSVGLSYLPQGFDASDSDSWAMRQLKDRDSTVLAGASYSLYTKIGIAKLSAGADILDNSNGLVANAVYSYPFNIGELVLTPSVGAHWASKKQNDYYYGVSRKESNRSGIKRYKADSDVSFSVGLDGRVNLTDHFQVYAISKAVFLSDEIKNSPMVDDKVKVYFGAGIGYRF